MTEDEAKTKWCPFAWRVMTPEARILGQLERDVQDAPEPMTRCVASECMAWRWLLNTQKIDDPVTKSVGIITVSSPVDGYCGLAGK